MGFLSFMLVNSWIGYLVLGNLSILQKNNVIEQGSPQSAYSIINYANGNGSGWTVESKGGPVLTELAGVYIGLGVLTTLKK
jgi:hypothetical protein